MTRVLLAGETWITYGVHLKGFGSYTTGSYSDGAAPLVKAALEYGHSLEHIANHRVPFDFPSTKEVLAGYDVVVLSDIPSDSLLLHPDTFDRGQRTPDRLMLLKDWTAAGGGLLMIGGYMSFSGFEGKANYQNTAIADVLPVRMLGYDDRVECPAGVWPRVVKSHEILVDIDAEWPYLLGYNRTIKGDTASVLVTVRDDPLLVVDSFGLGRVAAFTSDCSPHWGSPDFTGWRSYTRFWGQLLRWLGAASLAAAPLASEPMASDAVTASSHTA